jgi:hypothetical protein
LVKDIYALPKSVTATSKRIVTNDDASK